MGQGHWICLSSDALERSSMTTQRLLLVIALACSTAVLGCSSETGGTDGGAGDGGVPDASGGSGGDGGTGGTGASGGSGAMGGFGGGGYCESHSRCASGVCGDLPCFLSGCGVCECGQPACFCSGGFCECEPYEVGGECVPEDFLTVCAEHASELECEENDRCRWLVPGCDVATLPRAGCFPKEDCGDGWCGDMRCTYAATEECVGVLVCLERAE